MATKTWTVQNDPEALAWLAEIKKQYPLVPGHKLLRLALKHGLRKAAQDPGLVIQEHEKLKLYQSKT